MKPLRSGSVAPAIPGVALADGPRGIVFLKVSCPVCQMAAPKLSVFEAAYPGRTVAVGQDGEPDLRAFERRFGLEPPALSDPAPFDLSNAYGIRVVPTVFLVNGGLVEDVVESWDRDGLNRISERMASLLGVPSRPISDPADGLPPFRPG